MLHLKAHLRFNSTEHLRLHKILMVHMLASSKDALKNLNKDT